jgi:hypothetical protein
VFDDRRWKYTVDKNAVAAMSAEARLGLATYERWYVEFPPWERLGVLAFAQPWDHVTARFSSSPALWHRWAPVVFVLLFAVGGTCVGLSFLRPANPVLQAARTQGGL